MSPSRRPRPTSAHASPPPEAVLEGPAMAEPGARPAYKVASEGEVDRWIRAHGLRSTRRELEGMLPEALAELPIELGLASDQELSASEIAALERGGADPHPRAGVEDPLARGVADYAALLESALDVNAAAERAGVSPARIRQRLHSRSLIGVRVGNSWRVPLFQFDERGRLLPGLERVLPVIDPEAHVLAIQDWFLEEHVDLPADESEESSLSPRDWLRLGRAPARVVELARDV